MHPSFYVSLVTVCLAGPPGRPANQADGAFLCKDLSIYLSIYLIMGYDVILRVISYGFSDASIASYRRLWNLCNATEKAVDHVHQ